MTVKDIYQSMEYGPAPESAAPALAWLVDQGDRFGHFINGTFTDPDTGFLSRNPANGETLATLSQASQADVDAAVAAARTAQPKWARLGGPGRARYLYALARLMQKHARLFAVLETLDNGKPVRESRDIDIPLAQRHFYYHAGLAQLIDAEMPGRQPLGVCAQIIPWNFPLLMLAWKVAPALAAGNTVVLKPAEFTSLTALLFADICRQAGLPAGVVNIVTGDGAVGEMLVQSDIDKIAFTGSTATGRRIREATAGQGKSLSLELGGKSAFVVFDDADLDSAVEGLVDAIWLNQGQVCCAGSRLLVQESIGDLFHEKIRTRMETLRLGNPLDKCIDIGAMVDPVQLQRVTDMVRGSAGIHFTVDQPLPPEGAFYPPTLITGLSPADALMQEEVFGPVLVSTTFRTPDEAVALANNTRYGLAASVWSENLNLALGVAPKLAAGVVWINGANMFDAAAPFGGLRESGFGREGGWEGLRAYTRSTDSAKPLGRIEPFPGNASMTDQSSLDRTAKLYIGGKQARPDAGAARAIHSRSGRLIGHAPVAGRKDIRNAVEAARGAAVWSRTTGHQRSQILYYIAENLSARQDEFAKRLNTMTGTRSGKREVDAALQRLFTYAAWADKYDGAVCGVPIRGMTLALREPVGVIAALCPDDAPLLGLVSTLAPILAMGNRALLVASEPFPLAATDFYQLLETSDVPPGVANILTGVHADLAPTLASHMDIDAIWSFSSTDLSARIERASAGNLKCSWVNNGRARDWYGTPGAGREFLDAATEVKTIWMPAGV